MSKNSQWVIIKDGTKQVIDAPEHESEQLAAMQAAVGGYIELFMQLPSASRPDVTIDFYCNEEGRLNGMPFNVFVGEGGRSGAVFDIHGPVLVTAGNDEGETIALTDDEIKDIEMIEAGNDWSVEYVGNQ